MRIFLLQLLVIVFQQGFAKTRSRTALQSKQDQYSPQEYQAENEEQHCHFTPCCKQKANSVVSECFIVGPVLSGILSFALLNKMSSSPTSSGNCTVSTLAMTNAVETVSTFVTETVTTTTTTTITAMAEVTSVLLVTAMSTATINTIVEAATVTITLTVTSIVTMENTVRTISVTESCEVVKREVYEKMVEIGLISGDKVPDGNFFGPTAVLELGEKTKVYPEHPNVVSTVSRINEIESSFSAMHDK